MRGGLSFKLELPVTEHPTTTFLSNEIEAHNTLKNPGSRFCSSAVDRDVGTEDGTEVGSKVGEDMGIIVVVLVGNPVGNPVGFSDSIVGGVGVT